jgi:4-hydroxybenzoate polyprenyltransferase
MFGAGQLIGAVVLGLLFGAIAQSYGKRKNQPELGNIALIVCTLATILGGLFSFQHLAGLLTMIGFIAAISRK